MTALRPVLPGFLPDPSVCRVGDTYYLACSSFEYAPGLPILRSHDLRTWEHIGNALTRPSQLSLVDAAPSGGVFAPTLRHHDGRFWLITTVMGDPRGHLLVTAEDPAGPWSDPVHFPDAPGIDPDLAWDDDGTCYLTWAGFGDGGPLGVVQAVVDPTTGDVLSERRQLWQGTGGKYPEGPHLHHVGEWWYQLIAEGGTERGHAATIARGPSPSGPFESSPWNPLLTARGIDTPVQSIGHADLVERPDGSWALVYHGARVRGTSPQFHVLGRETFAADVTWEDGWPRVTGPVEPLAGAAVTEALTGTHLPPSWIAANRFPEEVLHAAEGGWRLVAAEGPVFVGRRQQHLCARIRAELTPVAGAGALELRIDPRHALSLETDGERIRAVARIGSVVSVLGETAAAPDAVLELRAEPSTGLQWSVDSGPDELVAAVVAGGTTVELGRLDGRYLSTEVAGGMTGRIAGLRCDAGELLVRSFEYVGADDPADLPAATAP